MNYARFKTSLGMLALLDTSFLCQRLFKAFDWLDDDLLDFLEWGCAIGIMIAGTDEERLTLSYRILKPCTTVLQRNQDDDLWLEHVDQNDAESLNRRWEKLYSPAPDEKVSWWRHTRSSDSVKTPTLPRKGLEDLIQVDWSAAENQISLAEFVYIVKALEQTRAQLIGENSSNETVPSEHISSVFNSVAHSIDSKGMRRLSLEDFRIAVATSVDFLSLLGIQPAAQLGVSMYESPLPTAHTEPRCSDYSPPRLPPPLADLPSRLESLSVSQLCSLRESLSCLQVALQRLSVPGEEPNLQMPSTRSRRHADALALVRSVIQNHTEESPRHFSPVPLEGLPRLSPPIDMMSSSSDSSSSSVLSGIFGRRDEQYKSASSLLFSPSTVRHCAERPDDPFQTRRLRDVKPPAPNVKFRRRDMQPLLLPPHTDSPPGVFLTASCCCPPRGGLDDLSRDDMSRRQEEVSRRLDEVSRRLEDVSRRPDDVTRRLDEVSRRLDDVSRRPDDVSRRSDDGRPVLDDPEPVPLPSRPATNSPTSLFSIYKARPVVLERLDTPPAPVNAALHQLSPANDSTPLESTPSDTPLTTTRGGPEEPPKPTLSDRIKADGALALIERLMLWLNDTIYAVSLNSRSRVLSDVGPELLSSERVRGRFGSANARGMNRSAGHPSEMSPWPRPEGAMLRQRMFTNPANFKTLRDQDRRQTKRRRVEQKLLDSGPRGLVVHFGHESWNMVLNMMVGLRIAAARASYEKPRPVEPYDFLMREKFSILPRASNVLDKLARYSYSAVRFIDYAPVVFRKLRESVGLQGADYLRSVGPEQLIGNMVLGNLSSMSELCSEGKSGALFYYTADGKFLVKTMTKESARFFRSILPNYFDFVMTHPGTLVTRFHGFHAIRLKTAAPGARRGGSSRQLYFVVMGNIFHTPVMLHRRYDLKGSWVGRTAVPGGKQLEDLEPTTALRDLDFKALREKIKLGPLRRPFLETIKADAEFLCGLDILDYSLLFGIHVRNLPPTSVLPATTSVAELPVESVDVGPPFERRDSSVSDGWFPWLSPDGMISTDKKAVYFCGVIDVFTRWTTRKKVEHVLKSTTADSQGISCVNPRIYADRFVRMLEMSTE